jgi:hypothetical protein
LGLCRNSAENGTLHLGTKLALVDFKASRCWVKKFKERRGIGIKVLHGEAGSADNNGLVLLKLCSQLFYEALTGKMYAMEMSLDIFTDNSLLGLWLRNAGRE